MIGNSAFDDPTVIRLFTLAAITTRAQLRTFVLTGNLPGGATITAAVFQRALLLLGGVNIKFAGETDDDMSDLGV